MIFCATVTSTVIATLLATRQLVLEGVSLVDLPASPD
jgi:hypothetical protein